MSVVVAVVDVEGLRSGVVEVVVAVIEVIVVVVVVVVVVQ